MIRAARQEDAPAIAALILEHDAATVALLSEHSTEVFVARAVGRLLRAPGVWCQVLDEGEPRGVFLATFAPALFAPQIVGQEVIWWITPAARGGTAAARMWWAFEAEAAARGARLVGMRDMDGSMAPHYVRRGYAATETIYGRMI